MQAGETHSDLIIVGGGIIGCAIAYYATKAGLRTTIVEREKLGGKASAVAAGLIAPAGQIKARSPFGDIATASFHLFPDLAKELYEDTRIDIEYNQLGSLRLALTEQEAMKLQERRPTQESYGYHLCWLPQENVSEYEPTVTQECIGAIFNPDEGYVNAQMLTKAFAQGAINRGAEIISAHYFSCIAEGSRIIGIHSSAGKIMGGAVVLATGAWVPYVLPDYPFTIPVTPLKGQLASVIDVDAQLKHIIFGDDIYLSPRRDSTLVIGATEEEQGYNDEVTLGGMFELFSHGLRLAPSLNSATLGSMRAGLRPRTPDKTPIIGKLPELERGYLAIGHNSNGILLSGITGQMVVAEVIGNEPEFEPERFNLLRFHNN